MRAARRSTATAYNRPRTRPTIQNLPGKLFEAKLYPTGPLYLLIVSADATPLPNLTPRAVLINPAATGGKARTVLTGDLYTFSLTRSGTDNRTYVLEYDDVEALAATGTQTEKGFSVEFVSGDNEVVMRGSFEFSTGLTTDDTDFDTLAITIDASPYVIEVSLPLRSVVGSGSGVGGSIPRYASILIALNASLPGGVTDQLCAIVRSGEKYYYIKDDGGNLWPLLGGPAVTLANYQSLA